jgi:hypothetical protein
MLIARESQLISAIASLPMLIPQFGLQLPSGTQAAQPLLFSIVNTTQKSEAWFN